MVRSDKNDRRTRCHRFSSNSLPSSWATLPECSQAALKSTKFASSHRVWSLNYMPIDRSCSKGLQLADRYDMIPKFGKSPKSKTKCDWRGLEESIYESLCAWSCERWACWDPNGYKQFAYTTPQASSSRRSTKWFLNLFELQWAHCWIFFVKSC